MAGVDRTAKHRRPRLPVGGIFLEQYNLAERSLIADRGGERNCSAGQRMLVQRASALQVWCIIIEQKAMRDEEISPDVLEVYQRMTNTQRRVLDSLGGATDQSRADAGGAHRGVRRSRRSAGRGIL